MTRQELLVYSSPWRMALLILCSLAFVGLGFWMVGLFGEVPEIRRQSAEFVQVVGWFSIAFFGLCAIGGIRRAVDTDSQLRISEQGIYWKPWSEDTIPRHGIRDVRVWKFQKQKAIVLCLNHPERYPSWSLLGNLAGANRSLTGGDISISLAGMSKSFDDALAATHEFRGIQ